MRNLFKVLFAAILFISVAEAKAQISVGPGVVYGTDINSIGFSINGKYEFNESWAVAPSFTYFLEKDYIKWSALDLDINYQLMDIEDVGRLYAIGGFNITFYKIDFDMEYEGYSDYSNEYNDAVNDAMSDSLDGSNIGFNIGLGLNFAVTEKIAIAPEIKYTFSDGGYARAGVKVMYSF